MRCLSILLKLIGHQIVEKVVGLGLMMHKGTVFWYLYYLQPFLCNSVLEIDLLLQSYKRELEISIETFKSVKWCRAWRFRNIFEVYLIDLHGYKITLQYPWQASWCFWVMTLTLLSVLKPLGLCILLHLTHENAWL